MQITPRYEGPAVVRIDAADADAARLVVRQARRLGRSLAGLDADQWSAITRCDGWTVRDVIAHLVTTNQFWAFSLSSAFAGAPSRLLVGFDPVASPAQLVDAEREVPPEEVLERYLAATEALAAVIEDADDQAWELPAEAPPGHVAAAAVTLHALWDSWVHERDVLLPLGVTPPEEADEVAASLRYAAALGPAFRASAGEPGAGAVAIRTHDPELELVVTVGPTVVVADGAAPEGTPVMAGPAVELLEAFSIRRPFPADVPAEAQSLLHGLATVFDQA